MLSLKPAFYTEQAEISGTHRFYRKGSMKLEQLKLVLTPQRANSGNQPERACARRQAFCRFRNKWGKKSPAYS